MQCKLQKEYASYFVFFSTFTALIVRFLTRRFIGEYASSSGMLFVIVFSYSIFFFFLLLLFREGLLIGLEKSAGLMRYMGGVTKCLQNQSLKSSIICFCGILCNLDFVFLYLGVCETIQQCSTRAIALMGAVPSRLRTACQ